MSNKIIEQQKALCEKFKTEYVTSCGQKKLGVADNIISNAVPINGFRHPPTDETTGWYLYAGEEISSNASFFKPLHVEHLSSRCPEVQKYLGLPPGWRFLIAGGYEDVWFDESLLSIET